MNHPRLLPSLGTIVTQLLFVVGCGSPPPPAETPSQSTQAPSRSSTPSIGIETEVGALDETGVQKALTRASRKLSDCFTKGAKRIPYLGGTIHFMIRVTVDGTTKWVYAKDSTLGDHATEQCMLGVMTATSWPKPVGGEGIIQNDFTFEVNADERPPVDWTPEQLGQPFQKVLPSLSSCRSRAGTGPIKATLYVDTDGKPVSVGLSNSDEHGEGARDCMLNILQEVTFPSPGSYPSKTSVTIE